MIDLKIFKILFDMTRIGWIIVGILVYFLLGWILKDIVFLLSQSKVILQWEMF